MNNLKDFPHPLNTPITVEEEITRIAPTFNPHTKQVSMEEVKEKVPVEITYHHVTPERLSCENKKHEWIMTDPKKWIASCKLCKKNRFITPLRHSLRNGHIVDRTTKKILE